MAWEDCDFLMAPGRRVRL